MLPASCPRCFCSSRSSHSRFLSLRGPSGSIGSPIRSGSVRSTRSPRSRHASRCGAPRGTWSSVRRAAPTPRPGPSRWARAGFASRPGREKRRSRCRSSGPRRAPLGGRGRGLEGRGGGRGHGARGDLWRPPLRLAHPHLDIDPLDRSRGGSGQGATRSAQGPAPTSSGSFCAEARPRALRERPPFAPPPAR